MIKEEYQQHLLLIDQKREILPWYVGEFIDFKQGENCSTNTLLTYLRDYIGFFEWIIAEGFHPGPMKEIPLPVLENFQMRHITSFQVHCKVQLENKQDTIARKISSLKSLFHYLSQIAEDENNDFYPYLKRNVMAKIKAVKDKVSDKKKAENIAGKILVGDQFAEFRTFLADGYAHELLRRNEKRKLSAHLKNRERDLALCSLILGSGLRLSEALSINLEDIDWKENTIAVTRKGNIDDIVPFSDLAALDMKEYLDVREAKYKTPKTEHAFFLSQPTGNGKPDRLKKRAAQLMFEKYCEVYGKNTLTIHKLRHSFATRHFQENNNIVMLKEILNHSDANTTMIYTHVSNQEIKDSINKTDK